MARENLEIYRVMPTTYSWTWQSLLCVGLGHPPLYHWPSWVWVIHFYLPFWSLPHHHDHRSHGSKNCQNSSCVANMFKSCPFVVTLTFDSLDHPKSFYIVSYHIDDVEFIMDLLWHGHFLSTSTHFPGSWPRLLCSTLELACPNGKFFTLNDKFTSFPFNWVISWVFDFSSCIHISWIVLIVPWGPLSLLVVSLALVNILHHWLVIKQLSSMFDVNRSIHMLRSVVWLGHVGAQDPDSDHIGLGCKVVWHGLWWYACIFQMVGCDQTMSYHMWSFSLLGGCDHTLVSLWSSLTEGCAHTWIHLHDHSLDGCIHTTIRVSFHRDLSLYICIYTFLQVFWW